MDDRNVNFEVQQTEPAAAPLETLAETPAEAPAVEKNDYTSPENILRGWKSNSKFATFQKVIIVILSIFYVLGFIAFMVAFAFLLIAHYGGGMVGLGPFSTLIGAPAVLITSSVLWSLGFLVLLVQNIGLLILGKWTIKQDVDYVALNKCSIFHDKNEKRNFQLVSTAILMAQKPSSLILVIFQMIHWIVTVTLVSVTAAFFAPNIMDWVIRPSGAPDSVSVVFVVLVFVWLIIMEILKAVLNSSAKKHLASKVETR